MIRILTSKRSIASPLVRMSAQFSSDFGQGAGKGGGSGGSIRDAGGSFGKMEAAREEEFFRRKQKDQLEQMKNSLDNHMDDIKKQIKEHDDEIKRLQDVLKKSK